MISNQVYVRPMSLHIVSNCFLLVEGFEDACCCKCNQIYDRYIRSQCRLDSFCWSYVRPYEPLYWKGVFCFTWLISRFVELSRKLHPNWRKMILKQSWLWWSVLLKIEVSALLVEVKIHWSSTRNMCVRNIGSLCWKAICEDHRILPAFNMYSKWW